MRLIDADALIEEYDRVHIGPPGGARKLMEDAPTIEEHKTGRWILIEKAPGFPDWICSECGGSGRGDYFYCPWCQIKMEVEHERSD